MKKIYSKIYTDTVCHIIFKASDFKDGRIDISDPKQFLQLSALKLENGKTFKPHRHIYQKRITDITQESWVVIKGSVKAILYDIDDSILEEIILEPGDLSITFRGGHNYLILQDDTLVYEYKTGPYNGQSKDKVFIEG